MANHRDLPIKNISGHLCKVILYLLYTKIVKVLFVNTNDTYSGTACAAYRLQSGLIELGIDVTYLVLNKESDG